MRTPLVTTFYETLDYCFDTVLRDMLGTEVRETVFGLLGKNGIPREDVSTRFDETVEVMVRVLGSCSRVVVLRTIAEMCKQYSQRMEFSYQDSLRDRLELLKNSVVANHLVPKRLHEDSDLYNSDARYQFTSLDVPKKAVKS